MNMLARFLAFLFFIFLPLTTSATITAPLSQGSTGPAVTELQTLLKRQGYYTSAITGKYGGFTIDAVKAYQGVNRLPITGTVNTATAKALNTAAASTTLRRPTLSFTVIPNPVVAGKPVTMQWQSTYASSCTGPNGLKGLSGSLKSQPLYTTTPLTITCTGKGGIARSRVLAQTVGSAQAPQIAQASPTSPPHTPATKPASPPSPEKPTGPTLTLSASAKSVPFGASVSITWSSTGATMCTATPTSAAHFSGISGTFVSRQLITPTTYTMACTAANGATTEKSVTVGIEGQTPPQDQPPQTPPPQTPPPPPGSGVCGSSHNQSFTTKPTNNLCSSGTPSTVSGTGPWTWSCSGSNGGSAATCTATKMSDPSPGADIHTSISDTNVPPATNTAYCALGFDVSTFADMPYSIVPYPSDTGALYTPTHVNTWRTAMTKGPYVVAGDAYSGSPGDFTEIKKDADAQVATPETPIELSLSNNGEGAFGFKTRDAGFVYLLTRDPRYLTATKQTLLAFFSSVNNTQVFFDHACFKSLTGAPQAPDAYYTHTAVIGRMAVAYDFVRQGLTPDERRIIENGLRRFAYFFAAHVDWSLGKLFPDRLSNNYSKRDTYASVAQSAWPKYVKEKFDTNEDCKIDANDIQTDYPVYTHTTARGDQGDWISYVSLAYNNRRSNEVELMALIGDILNDNVLLGRASRYVKEWLTYAVYPDGSEGEYERNGDYCIAPQGRVYAATNINTALLTDLTLLKRGDTSLDTFATRDGDFGTEVPALSTANKSLYWYMSNYFDLISGKKEWYMHEPWKSVQEPRAYTSLGAVLTYYMKSTTPSHNWHDLQFLRYAVAKGNQTWIDIILRKGVSGMPSVVTYPRMVSGIPAYGDRGNTDHQAIFPSLLFMAGVK